jgi:DNA processing protein
MIEKWLRFANLQLPPRLANSLLDRFSTPESIFTASESELEAVPGMTGKLAARVLDSSFLVMESQLSYLEKAGVSVIARGDDAYPRSLRDIPDPPPALFVRGELREKDRFAVALVGSRHASPYGRTITARLARDLTRSGLTIVSGGAIGIDIAAHRAVVEAGGRTVVVLGCGLDIDYPRDNQPVFDQVVANGQGAVVTEFPMGATPEPWRFPMRNRIISGMSMGVVVVEAGVQSGALLTASIATEQGREVMAVPGNVDRPGARGTNALIKDGASLVEDASDVLRALGVLEMTSPQPESRPALGHLSDTQRRLVESLTLTPKHIDTISTEVRMAPVEVSVQLTMLELSGQVRRLPGNCYIRAL